MKKHYLTQIDQFSPPIESEGQSLFDFENNQKGQSFQHEDRLFNLSSENENSRKLKKTEEN